MEAFALLATPVSTEPVRPLRPVPRADSVATVIVVHAQAELTVPIVRRYAQAGLQRHVQIMARAKVMAHALASLDLPGLIALSNAPLHRARV